MKMTYLDQGKKKILSWCDTIDEPAMQQARNLSNHPVTYSHIALMADCHSGYGMPIGGVIACMDAIIPNAVGVDIGCGMAFQRTPILASKVTQSQLNIIMDSVLQKIPVGYKRNEATTNWEGFNDMPDIPILINNLSVAKKSLGTLGGGNHFIELQKDSNGFLCVMVHSGSRYLGKQICVHYNKKALLLNRLSRSNIPGGWGLSFLPVSHPTGVEYINAMNFALNYAKENRRIMITHIIHIIKSVLKSILPKNIKMDILDVHHNYAAIEHQLGKDVYIHRKGAIRAYNDELGIIPGSMETPSYIVKGQGCKSSFNSASHGAGRIMSRSQAKKTLSTKEMEKRLQSKEILLKSNGPVIDECGFAYKNIQDVIAAQLDLITVIDKLIPIGVIKS